MQYCVYDCDVGSDDAWGLLMLMRAEALKSVKLLGVTCVSGNTSVDNVCKNALRVLKIAKREDIPVHRGAFGPLIPPKPGNQLCIFHGTDGFSDLEFEPFDHKELVHQKHAVEAMYEYAKKYPKEVTFILVGPLTNFALCLSMYEDFVENVKEVFIMGGNFRGIGNATRSAEFNFYKDPEAAKIVLEKTKCPITILPWEPCMEENFDISMDWRINELATQSSCPVVEMLTRIEEAQYIPQGFNTWCPCDAMLVASYLFPKGMIKKLSNWHATVEVYGEQTRGQMVLDHLQSPDNLQNVNLIEHLDCEYFKLVSLWAAGVTDNCNGVL